MFLTPEFCANYKYAAPRHILTMNELAQRIAYNERVILPHITQDNPEYASFIESIRRDKEQLRQMQNRNILGDTQNVVL